MATMSDILTAVSRATGLSVQQLRSPIRTRPFSRARFMAYYYCRTRSEVGKHSLIAIGKLLHRDHTSVISGLRRHEDLMLTGGYRKWWEATQVKFEAKLIGVTAERRLLEESYVKSLDVLRPDTLHVGEEPETAQCSQSSRRLPLS